MKKKQKRFLKAFLILLLIIIFVIGGFYLFSKEKDVYNYSNEIIEKAKDAGVFEELKGKEYSKTLEEAFLNNKFIKEYFDDYLLINYQNKDNFLDNINTLLHKGYSSEEINKIYTYLSNSNINKLMKTNYYKLDNYLSYHNLDIDHMERYVSYAKGKDLDLQEVITYVNIGLDNEGYVNAKEATNLKETYILVNKYHYLKSNFVPDNLVSLEDFPGSKMVKEAADAFHTLYNAYTKDGYTIEVTSAYRWYTWQETLYNNYSSKYGKDKADTFSARPGYSEHQTGLAVDLNDPNYKDRMSDADYEWMLNNSCKYGFIVRYPKNSSQITGYMEETWHLRYLGIDLATKVHNSNLTYDEYYDLYIESY